MRVNSIQFLRGVAALLVVYEHSMDLQIRFGTSLQQKFYHLDNFGCIGVDIFFVISGFIITYVANKYVGLDQGVQFLQKRFFRINPVYYIASFLCLGVYFLQLYFNHVPFTIFVDKTISSLIDSLIIIPTSADTKFFSPLLKVGWTLSFELLFYILFFVLILSNVKRKIFAFACLTIALIVIGKVLKLDDLRLQFITNPIMLEFLLGMIIYQLYSSATNIPAWAAKTLLIAGIISFLLLIRFGYGNVWHYEGIINGQSSIYRFILWGIPSSCIVAGCVFLEKYGFLAKLFNNKLTLFLGQTSYSIYLVHYTTLNAFRILYIKTKFFMQGDAMIWLQIITSVIISIGFYKLVEKPILNHLQNNKLNNDNKGKKYFKKTHGSKNLLPT